MPPWGIGLVRISRMRWPSSKCSWKVSCATASFINRSATSLLTSPGPKSPRSAQVRRMRSSDAPTRPSSGGRLSSSRNCRFQQISFMSLSNTLRPCRTWSSADWSRSRLYCSASEASSSSFSAEWLPAWLRRSSSESTSRDDAAPMALASRCSVKRSRWMSASALGDERRIAALGIFGEGALRALGAEVAGDGALQFAGRDGRAPHAEARRDRRPRQVVEHEQMRLQALDRLGRPQQRDRHERQHVGGHAPQHAVRQRLEAQVEQGVRATGSPGRTGLPS